MDLETETKTEGVSQYVLLDRDGVVNEAVRDGYVTSVEMVRLLPGAAEAIARLNRAGYGVIVVSNQQCVGKGLLSEAGLAAISDAIREQVRAQSGGVILDFLYCTHLAGDGCTCRKPNPGLLLDAHVRYGFDLRKTFFIGDSFSDMETARNAGCPAIFVMSGLDAERFLNEEPMAIEPVCVASDLETAVDWLLNRKDY